MKETIEKLAELMVLADPRDLNGLAQLHSLFEDIRNQAKENMDDWTAGVCLASGDLVQAIVMDEVIDSIAALEEVASSATALQQYIVEGRDRSELTLTPAIVAALGDIAAAKPTVDTTVQSEQTQDQSQTQQHLEENVDENVEQNTNQNVGQHEAALLTSKSTPTATEGLTGDLELTAEFVAEAREHLDAADAHMLTIESNPEDADAVNGLFRAFHTIKGVSGFLDLRAIQQLAHQTENLMDAARQGQLKLVGPNLDVVFDATDVMKQLVNFVAEALATGGALQSHAAQAGLIKRLDALQNNQQPEAVSDTPVNTPEHAPLAVPTAEVPAPKKASSDVLDTGSTNDLPTQKKPAAGEPASRTRVTLRETVKVDSARLDALVDTIGELVIAEAMVSQSQTLLALEDEAMNSRISQLSKITRELQEMATSLRMVPIRSTFQRMARLARDTAKKIDKQIEFVTTGEETELDKNVVDQIGDPLVHMVRNAVDHGIESSEEDRTAAGKSPVGRVELRAFHRGGSIYVQISDDGAGLHRDRILKKALERGLIREGDKLTDHQVNQLILEPGFSTAQIVSDVSGRGVGMDVVKRNIQAMRGQLEIISTPGKGTTFSIRLPLTLAIIDGMVLRVGNRRYVLPLLSITRMLRPDEKNIPSVFGKAEMLQADEGLIPLYRVYELFDVEGAQTDPSQASVVVVEHDGKRIGLLVDELLGQQQIVIKSLGESLRGAQGIAGGAIMPDGKVGLILDLYSLIKLASEQPTRHSAAA